MAVKHRKVKKHNRKVIKPVAKTKLVKNDSYRDTKLEVNVAGVPLSISVPESQREAFAKPDVAKKVLKKIKQEDRELLEELTLENCVKLHNTLIEMLDETTTVVDTFNKEENLKFLPYVSEPNRLLLLATSITTDAAEFRKEAESIKSLYKRFLNDDDTVKEAVPENDAYIMELVLDIKSRYLVCENRIRTVLQAQTIHLSDFYAAAVISYYRDGRVDEAPEDIREFINTKYDDYAGTSINAPTVDSVVDLTEEASDSTEETTKVEE